MGKEDELRFDNPHLYGEDIVYTLDPGYTFLLVTVNLKNISEGNNTYETTDIAVTDGEGYLYQARGEVTDLFDFLEEVWEITMSPDGYTEFWANSMSFTFERVELYEPIWVFYVPETATGLKLSFMDLPEIDLGQ